ncbi:MAG: S41 family peptidase [Chitinophagales bacterium]
MTKTLFLLLISLQICAQTTHPDSIRNELRYLFTELQTKHPGFYRYQNPEEIDPKIDSVLAQINAPMTPLEVYRLMKPLIAEIGCLHTSVTLLEEEEAKLNELPNCAPFLPFFEGDKTYISKTFDAESILQVGMEILRINGRDIAAIRDDLVRNVPMDGHIQSGKLLLLQHRFPLWYRNVLEDTTAFVVEVKTPEGEVQTLEVAGVLADVFPTFDEVVNKPLSLKIDSETAILQIASFAKSYHRGQGQKMKKEIKNYFRQIQKQNIQNLIVDLRGNTGGSDSNAADFASYFFDAPFRYWDRIEVAELMAKDIKGIARLFYSKPKQQDSIWLWRKSAWFTREFDFYQTQKPAKHAFDGQVIVLIDGLCMSSCADVAAILKHNKKAVFIGGETGGGYQGNTSGLIPEEPLKCGISIFVPLLKYVNAVDNGVNFGRGTMPDREISPTWEDTLEGRDVVLEKALEVIEEGE